MAKPNYSFEKRQREIAKKQAAKDAETGVDPSAPTDTPPARSE